MLFKDIPLGMGSGLAGAALAFPFPLRDGDTSGVVALDLFDLDGDGENSGYGSSSELSTPQRLRSELYDSRVSSSSSSSVVGIEPFGTEDFGNETRKDRNPPAYVLVTDLLEPWVRRESKGADALDVDATLSVSLEGVVGNIGREGVLSRALVCEVTEPSMDDSVLDLESIRFDNFEGDPEGDFVEMSSKIVEKSGAVFEDD